jgi:hypothetical protein
VLGSDEWLASFEQRIIEFVQARVMAKFANAEYLPEITDTVKSSVSELFKNGVVPGIDQYVDTATVRYGTIKTIAKSTYSRELKTILLKSKEPLITGIYISGIKIMCQRGATIIPYPSSSYLPDPARLKTSG